MISFFSLKGAYIHNYTVKVLRKMFEIMFYSIYISAKSIKLPILYNKRE